MVSPPIQRLCRKSDHGSTSSPRTDHGILKINYLAVCPERVEGQTVNCDAGSQGVGSPIITKAFLTESDIMCKLIFLGYNFHKLTVGLK